jgi:hypothetical protein
MYVCIRWGEFQHTLLECWACMLLGVRRQMLVHEIPRMDHYMVSASMVLTLVVFKIFFPGEIFDVKLTLGNCISNLMNHISMDRER